MDPRPQDLLQVLPAYQDKWVTIHPRQSVPDIIGEVIQAHKEFSPHYDKISVFFQAPTEKQVIKKIETFIKKNIRYQEEGEDDQTTAVPAGILTRLKGDCKHFSGFAAGILSALNRKGAGINYCYRFASYKWLDDMPHHVFIVVNPGKENETWIDPTPGGNTKAPVWIIDQKINDMALRRNLAGIDTVEDLEYIDLPVSNYNQAAISGPYWQLMPAEGVRGADGNRNTNPYFPASYGPFLGLQHYKEDPYSITGTDWNKTADAINQQVQKGPMPGHTWNADFVKWVYDTNLKGWNFYYPGGNKPGYVPVLPSWYPKLILTDDLRLIFDREYAIDDYMNNEIHALQHWAQDLINTFDKTPYPLTPQNLKTFSQGKAGDNLFSEHRGKPFFKQIGEALGKVIKKVGQGVLKIVGSIPRNAFLGMVGLNLFNFAGNMWEKIQQGKWEEMAAKWKKLGGNPEKLRNTIEKGKGKTPSYNDQQQVTLEDGAINGEPVTAAAVIAAAAPIIAAMMAFIKKPEDQEKLRTVLSATKAGLSTFFPKLDLTPLGFLDRESGRELDFVIDPSDDESGYYSPVKLPTKSELENLTGSGSMMQTLQQNPVPVSIGAGLVVYLLTNKKGQKKNFLIPALVGIGTYFLLKGKNSGLVPTSKRAYVIEYITRTGEQKDKDHYLPIFQRMSDPEIDIVYQWFTQYLAKGLKPPTSGTLYDNLMALDRKYKIIGS